MNPIRVAIKRIDLSDGMIDRLFKSHLLLLFLFLYVPIAVVIVLSFTPKSFPSFPMDGFSLEWYANLLPPDHNERIVNSLITSLQIGVISALGAGVVGTLAALGLVRSRFSSRWLQSDILYTFTLVPIVVPWIVTGIAGLTFFNLLGIQGTTLSLVIGHILICLPFVVLIVSTQLYQFDRSVEEAAMNLGASELRTFYEVTLPLIAPGIIAGMFFAFTISFDNFTQTFFWVSTQNQTLPVVIFGMIDYGLEPTVNAIGAIIVTVSALIAAAAERLSSRVLE
ncbi:ABC transporter permease [Natronorubrum bangense]|nr:ABC transporter permease [Natronorubrum bangense]